MVHVPDRVGHDQFSRGGRRLGRCHFGERGAVDDELELGGSGERGREGEEESEKGAGECTRAKQGGAGRGRAKRSEYI